jgi:hypothetical protein
MVLLQIEPTNALPRRVRYFPYEVMTRLMDTVATSSSSSRSAFSPLPVSTHVESYHPSRDLLDLFAALRSLVQTSRPYVFFAPSNKNARKKARKAQRQQQQTDQQTSTLGPPGGVWVVTAAVEKEEDSAAQRVARQLYAPRLGYQRLGPVMMGARTSADVQYRSTPLTQFQLAHTMNLIRRKGTNLRTLDLLERFDGQVCVCICICGHACVVYACAG